MDNLDLAEKHEQLNRDIAIDNARQGHAVEPPDEENGIRYCKDCGDDIDIKRLEIQPHAVRCVGCQTDRDLKNKGYR